MSRWKDMIADESKEKEPEVIEDGEEPVEGDMEAVEQDFKETLDEALEGFMERRMKENSRFKEVLDTNYYFVVCFSNNAQMNEFCTEFGLDLAYKYYDGREVAKAFRKALKTPSMGIPREKGHTKEYEERARKKE